MSRFFTINQNFFNLNFSLVFEDPGHFNTSQPFFAVRIYNSNNIMVRQIYAISDPSDCIFTSLTSPNGSPILYTGWICDRIDVSEFMNQNIRLEFIIANCKAGGHWGKVYIDEICGTNCANSLNGGIHINPIQTIDCPTQDIMICGFYTLPDQSQYDNISLNITQNSVVVASIPAPTNLSQNANGGAFCFTVPISLFGSNPNGNFEFQVQGNFTRICGGIGGNFPLDPIFDNSANDTGPDVGFINCIDAVGDGKVYYCDKPAFSVLNNDLVYSSPATPANTIIGLITPVPTGINFNTSTGLVTISPFLSAGNYTFQYQICNTNNPLHCDIATVSILILQNQINAIDDDFSLFSINGCDGGTTPSVLSNDTYCGQPIPISNSMNYFSLILLNNGGLTGATINSSGIIDVPPNTPPGTYFLIYRVTHVSGVSHNAQVTIVVNYGVVPEFSFLTEICKGSPAPQLPTTSDNGVNGTWNPSTINNQTSGTYTFTPSENCAETIAVSVTVIEECGLFLDWGGVVGCQTGNFEPTNFDYEDIEDAPCLRVCENSSATYTITGNTSTISNVKWSISGGTIVSVTQNGTVCEAQWGSSASGFIKVEVVLTDGSLMSIERCVEKMQPPEAYFEVVPYSGEEEIIVCAESTVVFDNQSTTNGGHGDLYYNWDFGDDQYSTAFEPTHIYEEPGNYEVTLYVFNGCSCADEYTLEITVAEPLAPIECPSVVCEGGFSIYSLPEEGGPVTWEAMGGDIIWDSDHSVSVEWNNVDENGFGYIVATAEECGDCVSAAKIPVVQAEGTIKGPGTLCAGSQGQYSLPQWPTTDFNWSLPNNTLGATLIQTNQRNEIIVQTQSSGTLTLVCNYQNTLLGCGGVATFDIVVKPFLTLVGTEGLCINDTGNFRFEDESGNLVSNVDWLVSGPNNFTLSGSVSPFTAAFPNPGTYVVEILSDAYCSGMMKIEVGGSDVAPTSISGPTTVCPGVPNTYMTTVPDGHTAHWQITNGDTLGASTGSEVSVDFFPGVLPFEVMVWFEDETGCLSPTYTLSVSPEMPDLNFAQGSASVCGSSYAMYEVADTTAETYFWEIIPSSAGSIQTGQNTNQVYILWNQAAINNVEVKVTARKCQVYFDNSMYVDIIQSPQITVGGDVDACVGQDATFNVSLPPGAGFTDITWDFGDGTTSGPITNSTSIAHQYKAPLSASTTYTVTATVTGVDGCTMESVDSFDVTVSPTPIITITPSIVDLCHNTTTTIIAVNQQGGFASSDTIQWYKNGGVLPNETNPTIDVANSPGDYHAQVTNVYGCTATTAVVEANDCNGGGPLVCGGDFSNFAYTWDITGCGEVTIDITNIGGSYINAYFFNYPQGAIEISKTDPVQLVLGNIPPGTWLAGLAISYNHNGNIENCWFPLEFTIPYSAGLKYNITCNNNNQYDVNLLDYSEYHPDYEPNQFDFNINGSAWQQALPNSNGVHEYNILLSPGTYTVGIRISRGGLPPCTAYETLELPALPNANFTFDAGCENEAVEFFAPQAPQGSSLQYKWEFPDATNLQKDPVKTFTAGASHPVKLTVTNKYGCSVSKTKSVSVLDVELGGELLKSPETDCEGGNITLTFTPSQTMPTEFWWYKNETTPTPYAVTSNPTLNVAENGQYYVFVKGPSGCWEYNNPPISVGFVQNPDAPVISGSAVVCNGNPIQLSVPESNDLYYKWYRDGQLQTQWNDKHEISDNQTSGTYVYTVFAETTHNGLTCTSAPGAFTVNVVNPPATPQIAIGDFSCSPYEVNVVVANPQPGVAYYWSNGGTGISTTMFHDGPIQVRAEVNNCSASAQIDLPTDLQALAWIFPKGCYYGGCNSDFLEGHVIGPLDGFYEWEWQDSQGAVLQGSGAVQDFDNIILNENYSLFLNNGPGECELDIGEMYVDVRDCEPCKIHVNLEGAHCINLNGNWIYEIYLDFNNNQGSPVWASLFVLNNQGYIANSNVQLPPGGSSHVLYYHPQGFSGGNLDISIRGTNEEGQTCYDQISINLPQCPPPIIPKPSAFENILVEVFPNPTPGMAIVRYKVPEPAESFSISIADLRGRDLMAQKLQQPQGELAFDCGILEAGTYMVTLKKQGKIITSLKLIVE
jgi:PKD repeat protein